MLLYYIISTTFSYFQLEHLMIEYARGLKDQTPRLEVWEVGGCSGERWEVEGVQVGGGRVFRFEVWEVGGVQVGGFFSQ